MRATGGPPRSVGAGTAADDALAPRGVRRRLWRAGGRAGRRRGPFRRAQGQGGRPSPPEGAR